MARLSARNARARRAPRRPGGARQGLAPALAGLLACACPSAPKEGPPPAESFEVASAAPHALGALAGGTQAAPHAVVSPGGVVHPAPDEPVPDPDEEDDAGTPTPDAGAGSPEDVPL